MTERGECPKHKISEDIIKLTQIDGITYEQVFRCGFKNMIKKMPPIKETIPVTDKVEAKVIRFRSLTEGPLLVSDNSGTSVASGSYQGIMINGAITDSNISINYNTFKINSNTITNINTIKDIFYMVDNSNNLTIEEKDQIKDTLTKVTDLVNATGSTAAKLATFLSAVRAILIPLNQLQEFNYRNPHDNYIKGDYNHHF